MKGVLYGEAWKQRRCTVCPTMFRDREDTKDRLSTFKSFKDPYERDTECVCVSLETRARLNSAYEAVF